MRSSTAEWENPLDARLGYLLVRVGMGMSMFLHGATRIFGEKGVAGFAEGITRQFTETPLPAPLVNLFGVGLPFVEGLVGISLLLGWGTRWGAFVGGLTLIALIFGTGLRQEWQTVGLQLGYVFLFYLLLTQRKHDFFGVDGLLEHRRPRGTS